MTDEAARVRSGMELIRWQTDADQWQQHLSFTESDQPKTWRPSPSVVLTAAAAGLVAAAIGENPMVAIIPLAALFILIMTRRNKSAPEAEDEKSDDGDDVNKEKERPPEVVITSTGVLFGDVALCWRNEDRELGRAYVTEGEPTYLHLELDSSSFDIPSEHLEIPIPSSLTEQVSEMTRTVLQPLSYWGRMAAPKRAKSLRAPDG